MTDTRKLRKRIGRITIGLLIASAIASLYGLYICVECSIGIMKNAGMGRLVIAPLIAELAEGLVLLIHYFLVAKFFVVEMQTEVINRNMQHL